MRESAAYTTYGPGRSTRATLPDAYRKGDIMKPILPLLALTLLSGYSNSALCQTKPSNSQPPIAAKPKQATAYIEALKLLDKPRAEVEKVLGKPLPAAPGETPDEDAEFTYQLKAEVPVKVRITYQDKKAVLLHIAFTK